MISSRRPSCPAQRLASLILSTILSTNAPAQEVLPAPPPPFKGKIAQSYKDSTPDFPQPAHAPQNAPNILLVLLDDVGFGASSTFGGPANTPTLDRLAKEGLRGIGTISGRFT